MAEGPICGDIQILFGDNSGKRHNSTAQAFADAGSDGLIMEPRQRGLDDWLRAVEELWNLMQPWHG